MGIRDRIRESLTGGGGNTDPPEYGCTACRNRFNSNESPRHVACPDCGSEDVELLANPDLADGSHPLDPDSGGADDETDERSGDDGDPEVPDDEEAAAVRELLTTGRYRCLDCREAFDPDDGEDATCPECGSDDVKQRFGD